MTQGSIKKLDRGLMNAKECALVADAVDTDMPRVSFTGPVPFVTLTAYAR
jgi:hypothetical protein